MSLSEAAAAMSPAVRSAMRADNAALETALAMVWHCLGCDLAEMAGRVVVERHGWAPTYEAPTYEQRVVVDGRVVHRQWWTQTSDRMLRQEWCP